MSGSEPKNVSQEQLADWFYNNGAEFVVDDEEEIAAKLLRDFDIRPKSNSHSHMDAERT